MQKMPQPKKHVAVIGGGLVSLRCMIDGWTELNDNRRHILFKIKSKSFGYSLDNDTEIKLT